MNNKIEALGVDIGGTSIKAAFVDEQGNLSGQFVVPVDLNLTQDELLGLVVKQAKEAVKEHPGCIGIGIGCPGAINPEKGTCDYSNNLHWRNLHVVEAFQKEIPLPAYIENDANAALLGDVQFGVGKNYKNIIFITLGTGVGGGILINGEIYSGNEGKGAELGHICIQINGNKCGCGRRGCLETYASASALLKQTKVAMEKDKSSLMWEYTNYDINNVNGLTSFECAKKGDKTANEVIDKYIMHLGEGMLDFCNIFRPQVFVIGGGISNQDKYLTDKLQNYLEKQNYGYLSAPKSIVKVASLKNDAGIIGAASLFLE